MYKDQSEDRCPLTYLHYKRVKRLNEQKLLYTTDLKTKHRAQHHFAFFSVRNLICTLYIFYRHLLNKSCKKVWTSVKLRVLSCLKKRILWFPSPMLIG